MIVVHFLNANQLCGRQPRCIYSPRTTLTFTFHGDTMTIIFLIFVSKPVSNGVFMQCFTKFTKTIEPLAHTSDGIFPLLCSFTMTVIITPRTNRTCRDIISYINLYLINALDSINNDINRSNDRNNGFRHSCPA
ncbi:hypothetical protein V8G54_017652 [Vigna mungo]|uniref:Uncharacterized protein n=1 Tax=Vigna mungo TaxID=3915 RepID=A0AAQ3NPV3_VIGMU